MIFQIVRFLPQNILSYLTGVFVRIEWWRPLGQVLIQLFIKIFRIDMSEAVDSDFRSIEDVFVRKIDMSLRPVEGHFVSPADGILVRAEKSQKSMAIQVKGIEYSLKELFLSEMDFAWYACIYLAPHNYHRVHSPVAGKLVKMSVIPGKLWPVNPRFVGIVPQLFCQNERMLFELELQDHKDARVHLAMVGALNVGRIQSKHWPDIYTNTLVPAKVHASFNKNIQKAEELGIFMLGSTVVLGLNQKAYELLAPQDVRESQKIQIGYSL